MALKELRGSNFGRTPLEEAEFEAPAPTIDQRRPSN
jgi:hypothetical protein